MTLEIVPLTEELIEGFHTTLDVVAREGRYLTLTAAEPLPDTRTFVLHGIARGDVHLAAMLDQTVVGWCDIRRGFFASRAHRGILGMGLLPHVRGRGFGKRLLLAALDRAWATAFTRIELDVYVDNAPAIALYEKVGFAREGLTRDAVLLNGQFKDALRMAILRRDIASDDVRGPSSISNNPETPPEPWNR